MFLLDHVFTEKMAPCLFLCSDLELEEEVEPLDTLVSLWEYVDVVDTLSYLETTLGFAIYDGPRTDIEYDDCIE